MILKIAGISVLAIVAIIVIVIAVLTSKSSDGSNPLVTEPWHTLRLPASISPLAYDLWLHPDLTTFTFAGKVTIEIQVTEPTSALWLHALELDINHVELVAGTETMSPTSTFFYAENEFFVMHWPSILKAATYKLTLAFNGTLTDQLAGFYRSSYYNDAGELKWIATTQFEATDARRAFPCFDEPVKKANFTLSMTIDPALNALGNMPSLAPVILESGLKFVQFIPSVKMSTYLVAFIVSDFVSIENQTASGITVRVWAPAEKISQAYVALDAGVKIIAHYETYFGVPYPLPKQDMVAIPDFAAGAMENWGLITYRETALLYDPLESSSADQQRVVVVVAHELAHQWFGNLVTMDWWSGLWLNEGFASYVEYVGTDFRRPEWDMWAQFTYSSRLGALDMDSSLSSHPVLQDVGNPSEISELFDAISYDKGASLIRMMVHFLGEDVFLAGLNLYLNAHRFGNANSADLWNAMSNATTMLGRRHDEAGWRGPVAVATDANAAALTTSAAPVVRAGIDVNSIMNLWTLQMGYPCITITDEGSGKLSAKQNRFIATGASAPTPEYKWDVSIATVTDSGLTSEQWLNRGADFVSIDYTSASAESWIKVDANETGFYRVNYPSHLWDALDRAFQRQDARLGDPDRMGLLDDAFALAGAGLLPLTQALNMTRGLASETSPWVWTVGINHLVTLDYLLRTQSDYSLFNKYVAKLLAVSYQTVGWNTTTGEHTTQILRASILSASTRWGIADAREVAMAKFKAFMADPVGGFIPADLRDAIYTVGAAEGGEAVWLFLWNRYQNTKVQAEARRCLRALSFTREPYLLTRLLSYSLDPTLIRAQDTITVVTWVSNNIIGESMAWEFVQDKWDTFYARYGTSSFQFAGLLNAVTRHFRTTGAHDDVTRFFEGKELGSGKRALAQALEVIDRNVQWLQTNYDPVVAWLRQHA